MSTPTQRERLTSLRKQIDMIDEKIVKLIDQRATIASRVGAAKGNGPIYRPTREAEVLDHVVKTSSGALPASMLTAVYSEIIAACRNLQQPLRVGYLEGTYCQEAAQKQCGASSIYQPVTTIDELVAMVEKNNTDIAVVPIENSNEGIVTGTLDLLETTSLTVCGEVTLPTRHRFLVLGQNKPEPSGNDKTSLLCSMPNKPGVQQAILSALAAQNINIIKLESRPSAKVLWERMFYIDIDGHSDDAHVSRALDLLRQQAVFIKLLGSYPKGR